MKEAPDDIKHLLEECKVIEENCLYTAQAHFEIASRVKKRSKLFFLIPSCISTLSGILTAIGLPSWLGAFAAISGLITGLFSVLGIGKQSSAHKQAANILTTLRHDARALHEAYWQEITRDQLFAEVRRLHDQYNALIQTLEMTDNASFEKARQRIKAGRFNPDFKSN